VLAAKVACDKQSTVFAAGAVYFLAYCCIAILSEGDYLRQANLLFLVYFALGYGVAAFSKEGPYRVLVPIATIQALIALFQFCSGRTQYHTLDLARSTGTYDSPTSLATLLAFVLPASIWLLLQNRGQWLALGVAASIVGLGTTFSRGPAIGALAGSVFVWLRCSPKGLRLICRLGVSGAICVLLLSPLVARISSSDRAAAAARSTRSHLTQQLAGLEAVARTPIGVGPGNIDVSYERQLSDGRTIPFESYDARNELVTVTLSFGWVGGMASLAMVAFAFNWLVRQSAPSTTPLLATAFSICVLSFVDSPFFVPNHECLCAILGLLCGQFLTAYGKRCASA
jgi:hypothetical protein